MQVSYTHGQCGVVEGQEIVARSLSLMVVIDISWIGPISV